MKKNLFSLFVFMLLATNIFGQIENSGTTDLKPLKKITPSPEVFAITKYGGLPINESTGKMIFNLPIYTYKAGNLNMPISLNYMGNGVKVNDLSTWTGINWTLHTGGVITRTVHHNPDEYAYHRIFEEDVNALNLYYPEDDADTLYIIYNLIQNNQYDTEFDIFNYSFLNYSGSFYLDKNYNPVSINGDVDLKIEILGNRTSNKENLLFDKHFKITTPDGVSYYFGLNATQDTERVIVGPLHSISTPLATTSFYLYKIVHPLGDTIFLDYNFDTGYSVIENTNYRSQRYEVGSGVFLEPDTIIDNDITSTTFGMPIPNPNFEKKEWEGMQTTTTKLNMYRSVYLSKIHSNKSNLEVHFETNASYNARFNFDKVLDKITVQNKNQDLVFQTDLAYYFNEYNGIKQRFFLNRVEINQPFDTTSNNMSRKYQKYQFYYKNLPNLPRRLSNSQDHFGYYNAKNNATLLPLPMPRYLLYGSFFGEGADRNSDFETRTTGVLTKIKYPTGGHTNIEYEAPQYKEEVKSTAYLDTYANGFNAHIDVLQATWALGNTIDLNGNLENENGVFKTQDITMNLEVLSAQQITHNHELVEIKINDVTNPNNIQSDTINVMLNPTAEANIVDGNFIISQDYQLRLLQGHSYTIQLKLNISNGYTNPTKARLYFTYISGEELVNGNGIRVKRISDFENDITSPPINTKRYYYTKAQNIGKNPLKYVETYIKPQYVQPSAFLVKKCSGESSNSLDLSCRAEARPGDILLSRPLNKNQQLINQYENVTVSYGGDDFEKGGVEKQFGKDIFEVVENMKDPEIWSYRHEDMLRKYRGSSWSSVFNGQLLEESVLSKNNGNLFKIRQTNFHKAYTNVNHISCILMNIYGDYGPGPSFPYKNVGLGRYSIFERKLFLKTTTIKEYIDPYPLIENILGLLSDESNYRQIVTTKTQKFNASFKGLITEEKIEPTSKGNTKLTKFHYVDDRNTLSGLDATSLSIYSDLFQKHIVNSPIQIENYIVKNNVENLLFTKRILYDNWDTSINSNYLTLPKKIQTAKGNNALEDRIVFENYDTQGNLTEVSYKGGAKIKYTYNGRNQVIEKIENYIAPIFVDIDSTDSAIDCPRASAYPNSIVTTYAYDPTTHLLISSTNTKCETTYYEYDSFQRLKYIKDKDGNILKEMDNNYKR